VVNILNQYFQDSEYRFFDIISPKISLSARDLLKEIYQSHDYNLNVNINELISEQQRLKTQFQLHSSHYILTSVIFTKINLP
jgi:hypothetical protein